MGSLRQQLHSTRRIMKYLVVMAVCMVGVCMAAPLEEKASVLVGPVFLKKSGNLKVGDSIWEGRVLRVPLLYGNWVPINKAMMAGNPLIRTTRQARDQAVAADTGYGVAPVGRVKIQTYRGPGSGYDKHHVNWGYYATQPADLGKGHAVHHK